MTIKVENAIIVYEVDGVKPDVKSDYPRLILRSHRDSSSRVVIETPDGKRYTVMARDLNAALHNATNTAA